MVTVDVDKNLVMVTDEWYSIAFIMLSDDLLVWDHWLLHGIYGWNLIPSPDGRYKRKSV